METFILPDPARALSRYMCSALDLHHVAGPKLPTFEAPGARFDHERGAPDGSGYATGRERAEVQHESGPVAEGDVDRESHSERMHLAAGSEHKGSFPAVSAYETARSAAPGITDLGNRQPVAVPIHPP